MGTVLGTDIHRLPYRGVPDSLNHQSSPTQLGTSPPMQPLDARKLLRHAEASHLGVRFTPGEACGGEPGCLRLCFAFYSPEELREAAIRLSKSIQGFSAASVQE